MRHIPRDWQTKATADHIAQKIKQNIIEIPIMKAQLFQKLEAMDNPASTATAANFGAAQLHREHPATLETDIPNLNFFPGQFLFGRCFNNRRAGFAPEKQAGCV